MRQIIMILVFILPGLMAMAQETDELVYDSDSQEFQVKGNSDEIKTLLAPGENGAYIDFTMRYAPIDDQDAVELGGKFGWVINHSLTLGLGGYGFVSEPSYNNTLQGDYGFAGGYGGFYIEQIILPKLPVHISVPLFFGVGGVSSFNAESHDWHHDSWDDDYDEWDSYSSVDDIDPFMIFKPGVEVELNVAKFLRINFGAYYAYTSNITLENDNNEMILGNNKPLNGLSYGVTFKLGKF